VSVVGLGQPQRSGKNPINQCMTLSKNCAFSEAVGMFIPIKGVWFLRRLMDTEQGSHQARMHPDQSRPQVKRKLARGVTA
jgi:hypothetical protein